MSNLSETDRDPIWLDAGAGGAARKIAIRQRAGKSPGLLWLGGFNSDMEGSKAVALDRWAAETGRGCTRFDYSGHGASGGAFLEGTISRWLEETLAVIRKRTEGPVLIVGSSMGGWLALLANGALVASGEGDRVAGLVLIAPAVDMTQDLMWDLFDDAAKRQLTETGQYRQPSDYSDEPYVLTQALIEDGQAHLFGDQPITTGCPVHIIQGMQDSDVPFAHGIKLMQRLVHDNAVLTLVRDGDHRLSRPEDLERLIRIVSEFPDKNPA